MQIISLFSDITTMFKVITPPTHTHTFYIPCKSPTLPQNWHHHLNIHACSSFNVILCHICFWQRTSGLTTWQLNKLDHKRKTKGGDGTAETSCFLLIPASKVRKLWCEKGLVAENKQDATVMHQSVILQVGILLFCLLEAEGYSNQPHQCGHFSVKGKNRLCHGTWQIMAAVKLRCRTKKVLASLGATFRRVLLCCQEGFGLNTSTDGLKIRWDQWKVVQDWKPREPVMRLWFVNEHVEQKLAHVYCSNYDLRAHMSHCEALSKMWKLWNLL